MNTNSAPKGRLGKTLLFYDTMNPNSVQAFFRLPSFVPAIQPNFFPYSNSDIVEHNRNPFPF